MRKILLLILMLGPNTLLAQDSDGAEGNFAGERFRFYLQAFRPALSTQVRLDSSGGQVGTTIDFEQNLGLEDTKTVPAAGFIWQIAKRHHLRFDYFELNRSSAAVTTSEIRFGDRVFQAELPIASYFDTEVFALNYSYGIIRKQRAYVGLLAGLSVQELSAGIKSNTDRPAVLEEESALTAPLPTFGLTGVYALSDRWLLRGIAGYFALELSLSDEENVGGQIVNVDAGIEYLAFENWSFELRYAYFNVDVDFTDNSRLTSIKYEYHGPKLGVAIRF